MLKYTDISIHFFTYMSLMKCFYKRVMIDHKLSGGVFF